MNSSDVKLIEHLLRRASFGSTRDEADRYVSMGYQAAVDFLIDSEDDSWVGEFMVRRFDHEASGMINYPGSARIWLYRMITTNSPLREKMTLFWHQLFATGDDKVINGRVLHEQIQMFRTHSMGKLDRLLLELAKDPAMIVWLDNQDNHKGAINENWGRELLELFSMGVGNYTEDDIKECARAFTGWTIGNTEYMMARSKKDSDWPYGRINYFFDYREDDHDGGVKEFLGHSGEFNGEEIINIICEQESTARFIARHFYNFFVSDEPPVPSWPYVPPKDPEAIQILVDAYFEGSYDIKHMLRVLFNSDFFKDEKIRYQKIKSPTELVAGTLRMTEEFDRPRYEMVMRNVQMGWMGQFLNNPFTVEGWHQGLEWIDSGTLVERLNFLSEQFGDIEKPGVSKMVDKLFEASVDYSASDLVEKCLNELGGLEVSTDTEEILVEFAGECLGQKEKFPQLIRLAAVCDEFQRT